MKNALVQDFKLALVFLNLYYVLTKSRYLPIGWYRSHVSCVPITVKRDTKKDKSISSSSQPHGTDNYVL